jgi:hypothetical protein
MESAGLHRFVHVLKVSDTVARHAFRPLIRSGAAAHRSTVSASRQQRQLCAVTSQVADPAHISV